ncbi:hypothetical protein LTR72_004278 [Exophiala xenobiotica]|nr:hypothetical protein LTR72_004278 [Exophiala xenobiotica]KAK5473871.1 hypothetical protein LTR55_010163 [Exophiala xenobiotica]
MPSIARTTSPVTIDELLPSLAKLWENGFSDQDTHRAAEIGVCVSGGPDSMALAWLLKQMPKVNKNLWIEPVAFIVDHKARAGSREEAEFVSSELNRLGIKNLILTMKWTGTANPLDLPDFELRAREARYRLIAAASVRRNIRHLFVGHHLDDQVETVLMRLLRNSTTNFLGLQGMAEQTAIPCCASIRGAHEWPGYERFLDWIRQPDFNIEMRQSESSSSDASGVNFGKTVTMPRPLGLQVHRPLLRFPKWRLVDVCETNHIKYVNDKTNDDPTLTLRNAIRHLRSEYTLPRAFQAESVLRLRDWAQKSTQVLVDRGTNLLNTFGNPTFDLRSGLMTVWIPKSFASACENDPEAAANALARLTSIVSCQPRDAVPTIVPWRSVREFAQKMLSPGSNAFTMQRVLLERVSTASNDGEQGSLWKLSRPPMRTMEVQLATMKFNALAVTENKPVSQFWRQDLFLNKEGLCSLWLLWDHRYWVRVRTKDSHTLGEIGIRPFQVTDEEYLRKKLDKKERDDLQKILGEASPGKLRYTLPVLTWQDKLSVFPTLNFMVETPSCEQFEARARDHPILEWEVCCKTIDQYFMVDQKKTIKWINTDIQQG